MIVFCEDCGVKINTSLKSQEWKSGAYLCDACRGVTLAAGSRGEAGRGRPKPAKSKTPPSPAGDPKQPLKLLIVDDSRLIRRVICDMFANDRRFKIVGEAENGAEALKMIPKVNPDVVTLDINMPVMDGLTTLKHIMIRTPVPTVMFSTLTREGATETFDALRFGAIDFMLKPSQMAGDIEKQKKEIIERVRMVAAVEMGRVRYVPARSKQANPGPAPGGNCEKVFAVGAAEGGYGALLKLIPFIRPDIPAAFLVVLYAEPKHVEAFVEYLNEASRLRVRRATDGDKLENGTCYVSSGIEYVTVNGNGPSQYLQISRAPFPGRRGSIDMLMISLAETMLSRSAGIILTGAGKDGVEGIIEISRLGGTVFVQEPRTCLFRDMPNAAIATGRFTQILPDSTMADQINRVL